MRAIAFLTVLTLPLAAAAQEAGTPYPQSRTVDVSDDYHGTSVADPYRWLEDDVRESADVAAWVQAESEFTNAFLDSIGGREAIAGRMTALWDFDAYSLAEKKGGRIFFRKRSEGEDQSVLYVMDEAGAEPRELIDPNEWSDDGTIALAEIKPSPDGSQLLYTIQDGGTDWRTAKVLDVETGEVMSDTVEWIKFSGLDWAPDGSGFYYSRYPAPEEGAKFQNLNYDHKVYFHELGDGQADDTLIYDRPEEPDVSLSAEISDDGEWIVVTASKGTDEAYEIMIRRVGQPDAEFFKLFGGFKDEFALIGSANNRLYFRTNRGAPRGKIIAVVPNGEQTVSAEIVPESENTLIDASVVGDRIIAEYLIDAKSAALVYAMDGVWEGQVDLPGLGEASGFNGKYGDPETFYAFQSFRRPETIYSYNVETGESEELFAPDLPYDPDDYVIEQVFYESKDGAEIPMFIARRADIELDEPRPALLYGYGGFNISYTSRFFPQFLTWMDMGGVFANANIRGGGEYGKEWHDAGRLDNKQNVFDDFIAAGEYLIAEGITTSEQLGVHGRSNGGLLVGAVVNQRPDLMAVGLPTVGVMDMLRFNQFTAGRFWTDDYGDPGVADDFETLYAYSPYHNIDADADYPAILATTADTDDRVVPGHTFKYIARLQAAQGGDIPADGQPVLARIETRAGHGSGKPKSKLIEEYSDQLAFLAHFTGLEVPETEDAGGDMEESN
ncbi:MAG: S9 family peptidase [Euryhalocaulis sp.]|uniref:prolyl oligopeptidase family serine peptidase n=1 Tax=Euryhalocaulis sp. TaxID=2744307 RepID=UPI001811BCCA|nr:prolyl oligopeptidase family serine peptidase [Euryhalocaulis sp.]MBA4801868.1 S9 family peptidase [Euryhalocaulis sp.]